MKDIELKDKALQELYKRTDGLTLYEGEGSAILELRDVIKDLIKEIDEIATDKQVPLRLLKPLFALHRCLQDKNDNFYYRADIGDEIERIQEILER